MAPAAITRPNHTQPESVRKLHSRTKHLLSKSGLQAEARAQTADANATVPRGVRTHLYACLYDRVRALVQLSILFALEREKAAGAQGRPELKEEDVQRAIGRAHDLEEALEAEETANENNNNSGGADGGGDDEGAGEDKDKSDVESSQHEIEHESDVRGATRGSPPQSPPASAVF